MGAPLGPHPVLAARKAALVGLTGGHLGSLDSPVRVPLRAGRRLAQSVSQSGGGKEAVGRPLVWPERGCGLQGPSRPGPWGCTFSPGSVNSVGMGTSRKAPPTKSPEA